VSHLARDAEAEMGRADLEKQFDGLWLELGHLNCFMDCETGESASEARHLHRSIVRCGGRWLGQPPCGSVQPGS
jgi:hypothetical protein